jgi:hypothetical protein
LDSPNIFRILHQITGYMIYKKKLLTPQSWLDKNSSKYPNGTIVSKVMMGYAKYYHEYINTINATNGK